MNNLISHQTQDEYYYDAVYAWQRANKNLKHFAECCSHVTEGRTSALAADCGCSVDTIENYRRAYALYQELDTNGILPSEPVREVWEKAPAALWVKAAQLKTRLDLTTQKTWNYLQIAAVENMTREQMAAHVDEKENNTPKWIRRLHSAIRFLSPSKNDYKFEMPPELQSRYDRAVSAFIEELDAISKYVEEAAG